MVCLQNNEWHIQTKRQHKLSSEAQTTISISPQIQFTVSFNGSESGSYLGPKIREQIPSEIKNNNTLDDFKKEIREWKPVTCPCRI